MLPWVGERQCYIPSMPPWVGERQWYIHQHASLGGYGDSGTYTSMPPWVGVLGCISPYMPPLVYRVVPPPLVYMPSYTLLGTPWYARPPRRSTPHGEQGEGLPR